LKIGKLENVEIGKCGKCGNVEIGKCGNWKMWKCENDARP
jgi:hypothetical protein